MKNKTKLKHSEIKLKHVYGINEGSIEIMKKQVIKDFLKRVHVNDLAKLVNLTMKDCESGNAQYPDGIKLSCSLWVDKIE